MVVLTQVLTSLSLHCAGLPVSGSKNVGMHTLVPSPSTEPLNVPSCGLPRKTTPDSAWRRVLNCSTAGLSLCTVDLLGRGSPSPVYAERGVCPIQLLIKKYSAALTLPAQARKPPCGRNSESCNATNFEEGSFFFSW
jgi:hypothetical protein